MDIRTRLAKALHEKAHPEAPWDKAGDVARKNALLEADRVIAGEKTPFRWWLQGHKPEIAVVMGCANVLAALFIVLYIGRLIW